jgi:hypothetical protein
VKFISPIGFGFRTLTLCVFILATIGCSSEPDCWEAGYKEGYCAGLVLTGKGTGSCDSVAAPKSCWEKELEITKRGFRTGMKDAEKR